MKISYILLPILLFLLSCKKKEVEIDCTIVPKSSNPSIGFNIDIRRINFGKGRYDQKNQDRIFFVKNNDNQLSLFSWNKVTNDTNEIVKGVFFHPDHSIDGKWVFNRVDNQIYILRQDEDIAEQLSQVGINNNPRWDHLGKKIIYSAHKEEYRQIYIMDEMGNDLDTIRSFGAKQPAFSPDDQTITYIKPGVNTSSICVYNLIEGEELVYQVNGFVSDVEWINDKLIFFKTSFQACTIHAETGEQNLLFENCYNSVYSFPSMNSSGNKILFDKTTQSIIDLESNKWKSKTDLVEYDIDNRELNTLNLVDVFK